MEHLLKDGGDLDSMDRSLLDYGQNKGLLNQQNGTHPLASAADASSLPHPPPSLTSQQQQQHQQAVNSTDASHHNVATVIFSAATPPATPMASPEGVNVMPVIKRDLVVRFREQKNSVQCEMAAAKRGDGNSAPAGNAATTPIQYKEQYEAQHYSRHPHGPMSPCDSENSVCNRSRENLIGKILPIRQNRKILLYSIDNNIRYLSVRHGYSHVILW